LGSFHLVIGLGIELVVAINHELKLLILCVRIDLDREFIVMVLNRRRRLFGEYLELHLYGINFEDMVLQLGDD
jgi:hypothetical protein